MATILFSSYPLVSQASWWNPLSWNRALENKPPMTDDALNQKIKELENKIIEIGTKTTSTTSISTNVPSTTEKINMDDKVFSLTKENNQLKAQIKTLNDKILICEKSPTKNSPIKETETVSVDTNSERAVVTQQFIPSKDGKGYGFYKTRLKITAGNQDLYIPKTTTDSAINDIIGISYSTIGGDSVDFKGIRLSTVACSTTKDIPAGNVCYVRAGTSLDIDVNIYLRPDESGTYSIKLENIRYHFEKSTNKYGVSSNKIEIDGDTQSDSLYIL